MLLEQSRSGTTGPEQVDLPEMLNRLLLAADQAIDRDPASASERIAIATQLLLPSPATSRAPTTGSGTLAPWQIGRLQAHATARISDPLTNRDLAEVVRLSPGHFGRAFKASFGVTPHQFVVSLRIREAKRLMTGGDAPLSEIALMCGLTDQAHLSRLFRESEGVSPAAWRRSTRCSLAD